MGSDVATCMAIADAAFHRMVLTNLNVLSGLQLIQRLTYSLLALLVKLAHLRRLARKLRL